MNELQLLPSKVKDSYSHISKQLFFWSVGIQIKMSSSSKANSDSDSHLQIDNFLMKTVQKQIGQKSIMKKTRSLTKQELAILNNYAHQVSISLQKPSKDSPFQSSTSPVEKIQSKKDLNKTDSFEYTANFLSLVQFDHDLKKAGNSSKESGKGVNYYKYHSDIQNSGPIPENEQHQEIQNPYLSKSIVNQQNQIQSKQIFVLQHSPSSASSNQNQKQKKSHSKKIIVKILEKMSEMSEKMSEMSEKMSEMQNRNNLIQLGILKEISKINSNISELNYQNSCVSQRLTNLQNEVGIIKKDKEDSQTVAKVPQKKNKTNIHNEKNKRVEQAKTQQIPEQQKPQQPKKEQKQEPTWSKYLGEVTMFPKKTSFKDWMSSLGFKQNEHFKNPEKTESKDPTKRFATVELRSDVYEKIEGVSYENKKVHFEKLN